MRGRSISRFRVFLPRSCLGAVFGAILEPFWLPKWTQKRIQNETQKKVQFLENRPNTCVQILVLFGMQKRGVWSAAPAFPPRVPKVIRFRYIVIGQSRITDLTRHVAPTGGCCGGLSTLRGTPPQHHFVRNGLRRYHALEVTTSCATIWLGFVLVSLFLYHYS